MSVVMRCVESGNRDHDARSLKLRKNTWLYRMERPECRGNVAPLRRDHVMTSERQHMSCKRSAQIYSVDAEWGNRTA